MNLQRRFHWYLLALHAVFFGIALTVYHERPVLVVAIEFLLLLTYLCGFFLLKKALLPMAFARQFQDLLQDENYAARLKTSSNHDMNALVELFNRMLEALYRERVSLGEQRGFLDQLLEATPSAVIVFDFEGKVSLCNACALTMLAGHIEVGQALLPGQDLASAQFVAQLQAIAVGESIVASDVQGRRFRCQRSQFVDRGFSRQFLIIDEITEELASSEKSTYEKVVRVLAHEVNNTVAATGSVLESILFYRQQLRPEDSVDFSTAILAVQKRNTNLAKFIERFTQVVKMPDLHLEACDVGEILDAVLILYRQPCQERGIALEWVCRDVLPLQRMDRHLFEQAMLNIIKNAIEAVEVAQKVHAQESHFVRISLCAASESTPVHLSICDSGRGLQNIPASQLFTPFFTTKKGGQGIGLMLVREVLNRHGYVHRLAANAQGHTQFDIYLEQQ